MNSRGRANKPARWLDPATTGAQKNLRDLLDLAANRAADEVALRRVWSRLAHVAELVESEPPQRRSDRRWWYWAAAASLVGAGAAVAVMLLASRHQSKGQAPVVAMVVAPTPAAQVEQPEKMRSLVLDRSVARGRSRLATPATVRTARGEVLEVILHGGTKAALASESELSLDEDDRLIVAAGEIRFHVPPQPAGRTIVVVARQYRAVVVGTEFVVRVDDFGTKIHVDQGVVDIRGTDGDERVARIGPGQSWVAPATERVGGVETDPGHAALPAAAGTTSSSGARSRYPGHHYRSSRSLSSRERGAAERDASRFATASGSDVLALVSQAKVARAAGDPIRALGLYRAVADRGGPAGEDAEYEMGRILRDGLAQPEQAIATWRGYRARHPNGLLRIEADISVIETLMSLNDKSGALAEASDFTQRYPDGERRAEMARLAGDLFRERGDWRAAIEAYDQVLAKVRARSGFMDDVSFHRSTCLLQGDTGRGAEALRSYLKDFPGGHFRAQAERLIAEASPQSTPRP